MEEMNLNFTFENSWNHSCLIVDTSAPYTEEYQIKMLKNNSIPGLLKISGNGLEGKSRYTYPVEGMLSFSQKYAEQKISFSTLNFLISQLIELTHTLGNYLLNPDCILLNPDCIFEPRELLSSQSEPDFYFCYVPSFSDSLSDSFHKLTEFIVQNLDYNDDNGILLACLLHKETLQKNYHLESLLQNCKKKAASKTGYHCSEPTSKSHSRKALSPEVPEDLDKKALTQSGRIASEASNPGSESLFYASEGNSMPLMEESRYRPFKRISSKIKNTHWGNWDDLITEADEYDPQ